jgi:dihydroneopterin aldolase
MAKTHIFIRNLEVLVRIGIHGHEQGMPQPVRINVAMCLSDKRVSNVRIRVEKLHALQGAEAAGVEIERP